MKPRKRNFCYDLECFPNFFSNTLVDLDSDTAIKFVIHEDVNELADMITFMEDHVGWLIGYNNSKYDDIIMRFLVKKFELLDLTAIELTQKLYELSVEIIGSQRNGGQLWQSAVVKPYLKETPELFGSIDLMSMMAFDKSRVGLKKVAVAMQWPVIQDLPKPFDEEVDKREVPDVLKYNMNDVLITKELALQQKGEIQIRVDVGGLYGVNLMSSSRASMADKLMAKFWGDATGQKFWDFKKQRTKYEFITLGDCISDKVGFKSKNLQEMHERIKKYLWNPSSKFAESVVINRTKYDVLLGGLHSVRRIVIEEDDEYELWDLDVKM